MRINSFHPRSPSDTQKQSSSEFREILESIGRYEANAERALARASAPSAQFEDMLALQMEVQLWSQSADMFGRLAGQASRSLQELARSTQ